jgi:hypothetical protein
MKTGSFPVAGLAAAAALLLLLQSAAPARAQVQEWPFQIQSDDWLITIYSPQVESFTGDRLTARAAVSVLVTGRDAPVFGAVWFGARAHTDRGARTVELDGIEIEKTRFPNAEKRQLDRFRGIIEAELPLWEFTLSLDDLTAELEHIEKRRIAAEDLNMDPPAIHVRNAPAALVTIDGDPILKEIEGSRMKYVVNTPFFIVYDGSVKQYYLRGGEWWYASRDAISGWRQVEKPSADVMRLAEQADEQGAAPPDSGFTGTGIPPEIIVSAVPAELIVTEGEPEFSAVEETQLLYITNTESDVFVDIDSQRYFILLSGRWFTSPTMDGPWEHVAPDGLPPDFARIPADSDMGHVLVSVPGTEQAEEAVLDAYVPQTAVIDRKEATVEVEYDGQPLFEDIEGTDLRYAANTPDAVILCGGRYYCCDEAVWFVSQNPAGPWEVCVEVPDAIYTIPPTSPVYNVTYVRVYDHTPTVVYTGYLPGYTCSYVYAGTVVYGTGYYYRPWYRTYYYPRYATWGWGVTWNPYSGWGFSFGVGFGGPYGWFRVGWGRPYYPYWWGPAGYRQAYWAGYRRGYYHGYHHPRPTPYGAGHRGGYYSAKPENLYRDRKSGVRETGGRAPAKVPVQQPATRPATREKTPSQLPADRAAPARNNVYVDRDGNAYRKTDKGWEKNTREGWSPAVPGEKQKRQIDDKTRSDLNRHYDAREKGARRTEDYQRSKSTDQRQTRQPSTGSRDTRQPSTGQRQTRQPAPSRQSRPNTQKSGKGRKR